MKFWIESLKSNFLKNRILVENFTFLSVLQASNLLLFIITIPYLFRVLGSKTYGLVVFAQTIVYYFTILVNFGFNLTATRDISVNRDDHGKVSEIVSSVLIIKTSFFLISFILIAVSTFTITSLSQYRALFLLSMLSCLSEALFPVWFFQGIEKMKYITFINVSFRVMATLAVFVVITRQADFYMYPLILGTGTVAGALTGLYIVFRKYRIRFSFEKIEILKRYFTENIAYFFSNVSTQIYLNANRIIVGAFLGMTQVAYYDVAEKVINILKVPYSLLGQSLFPRIAHGKRLGLLRKVTLWSLGLAVLIIICIFYFSGTIIHFFSGTVNTESTAALRILSLALVPISLGLYYGDILLINFGLKERYLLMRLMGLIFYVFLISLMFILHSAGLREFATAIVLTETFIVIYSWILCRKIII
ncbi:MAG TPA: oligosaccharide flippase family protein [Bacteroidales bacterium]|nr:oligosaccharide flippase family protein [Bacteroidales bacterium]